MPKAVVGTNARKNLLKQDFEKAVKKRWLGIIRKVNSTVNMA